MGNQAKPSFSVNSAGATTNSGGAYFIRQGGSVKTALPTNHFTTRGLGGPLEGQDYQVLLPFSPATLTALMTLSNSLIIGDGKLNYNFLQCIWNTQDTSISGIEFGYLDFGALGGGTTATGTFVRLLTLPTSSATPFGVSYGGGAINFTPVDGRAYVFGMFNNSGGAINRVGFMATISANDNLS